MTVTDKAALDDAIAIISDLHGHELTVAALKDMREREEFIHVPSTRNMSRDEIEVQVEKVWKEFWEPIVARAHEEAEEAQDIHLTREVAGGFSRAELWQVKLELFDYHEMMHGVSVAFDALTMGRISKPNTDPYVVIEFAEERIREGAAQDILDVLDIYAEELVADETDPSIGVLKIQASAIREVANTIRVNLGFSQPEE